MKIHEKFTGKIDVDGVEYSYEGCRRDWNPLPGYDFPEGTVYEVFTDDATGFDATKEGALDRLKYMIRNIRDYEAT